MTQGVGAQRLDRVVGAGRVRLHGTGQVRARLGRATHAEQQLAEIELDRCMSWRHRRGAFDQREHRRLRVVVDRRVQLEADRGQSRDRPRLGRA